MIHNEVLVFGIGNPLRGDDGLGFAFVNQLKEDKNIHLKHAYQLNIEDAEVIQQYKKVIFVDAAVDLEKDFKIVYMSPKSQTQFSSHSLDIPTVMSICLEVYQRLPTVILLKIKGDKFGLNDQLSELSKKRLDLALNILSELL